MLSSRLRKALSKFTSRDDAPSKISSAFRLFDKKGRGYVTQTHFRKVIAKLKIKGVTDDDADLLASCFDVNGDGKYRMQNSNDTCVPHLKIASFAWSTLFGLSFAHMLQLKVEGAWLCDRFFKVGCK